MHFVYWVDVHNSCGALIFHWRFSRKLEGVPMGSHGDLYATILGESWRKASVLRMFSATSIYGDFFFMVYGKVLSKTLSHLILFFGLLTASASSRVRWGHGSFPGLLWRGNGRSTEGARLLRRSQV